MTLYHLGLFLLQILRTPTPAILSQKECADTESEGPEIAWFPVWLEQCYQDPSLPISELSVTFFHKLALFSDDKLRILYHFVMRFSRKENFLLSRP